MQFEIIKLFINLKEADSVHKFRFSQEKEILRVQEGGIT